MLIHHHQKEIDWFLISLNSHFYHFSQGKLLVLRGIMSNLYNDAIYKIIIKIYLVFCIFRSLESLMGMINIDSWIEENFKSQNISKVPCPGAMIEPPSFASQKPIHLLERTRSSPITTLSCMRTTFKSFDIILLHFISYVNRDIESYFTFVYSLHNNIISTSVRYRYCTGIWIYIYLPVLFYFKQKILIFIHFEEYFIIF